ncbi:hypothetical protein PGS49_19800 [Yersinia intermedia]|uniref:Phage protein n=2 Tax=Yersinia TaxID=629 RepID=A0ABX6F5J4_YERIN|nr:MULTISPECIES: hypothetical protein [Yersinia]MDA5482872.1 hypothetical protein [Yersinia intermedia]QGR65282.1 hypothetical protein FOC38_04565 [Yersinia intermedia]QGR70299.1 hypothetical protein FOC37_07870 [Yersinia intermedia]CNF52129.1 Uncharacterised protein [Yersinia frederiksenii]CNL32018.1 Uncharacterised protein [Yersinia frederiksenii]
MMDTMRYSDAIQYTDAMEWLLDNYQQFPDKVLTSEKCKEISNRMFKNWRWVLTLDGEVIFGNCIQPGITKEAFDRCKLEAFA